MPLLTMLISRLSAIRGQTGSASTPIAAAAAVPPARVSLDDQMDRVDSYVTASLDRTALTGRYHAAAEDQLDAATYALREVMKDLAAVMTLPALRTSATLYQLPVASAPAPVRRRVSAAA